MTTQRRDMTRQPGASARLKTPAAWSLLALVAALLLAACGRGAGPATAASGGATSSSPLTVATATVAVVTAETTPVATQSRATATSTSTSTPPTSVTRAASATVARPITTPEPPGATATATTAPPAAIATATATQPPEPCPGAIAWDQAAEYAGQVVTVIGPVIGTTYASASRGAPTFLNVGKPYPDPARFVVVIWGGNRDNFPNAPEGLYRDRTLCVTGIVELYNGVPEIQIGGPDEIVMP